MDYHKLADLLFPHITKTTEEIETQYPKRNLPEGAKVTRLGPSPTGFIHLGNLYGAFVDERLAHQSGGVFYLRIEDTDAKRYAIPRVSEERFISALQRSWLQKARRILVSSPKKKLRRFVQGRKQRRPIRASTVPMQRTETFLWRKSRQIWLRANPMSSDCAPAEIRRQLRRM